MLKYRFIIFTALRYLKARKKSKGFASSLLSIVGIAFGILLLTVVIGIMNGFQLTYINNRIEISSYHLQIVAREAKPLSADDLAQIKKIEGVTAVVPFREFQVMIEPAQQQAETRYGILRALDYEAALQDESFIRHLFSGDNERADLEQMKAEFRVQKPNSVLVGYLMAYQMGVGRQSAIVISSINDIVASAGTVDESYASSRTFSVSGIFKSWYKDIDENNLFISLDSSAAFLNSPGNARDFPLHYGIKIENRFQDLPVKSRIQTLLDPAQFEVTTWRDYNKSYFGALLMEKLIMMILVGLIFIVVGFNIYNSLRRIVLEKIEEIAVLKAVGASPNAVRAIFIFEGVLIGLAGGIIGLLVGLFTATHINGVFNFITDIGNVVLRFVEQILAGLGKVVDLGILESPFSPRVYYFREVPSVVIPEEAFFMVMFAVLSALGAAFLASKKISGVKPAEVLRYE